MSFTNSSLGSTGDFFINTVLYEKLINRILNLFLLHDGVSLGHYIMSLYYYILIYPGSDVWNRNGIFFPVYYQ